MAGYSSIRWSHSFGGMNIRTAQAAQAIWSNGTSFQSLQLVSGILCLLTCFGFFALKFLNALPVLFSFQLLLSAEFHIILPLNSIYRKWLWVKNLWYNVPMQKSNSLSLFSTSFYSPFHLNFTLIVDTPKPSWFMIFLWIVVFFSWNRSEETPNLA